MNQNQRFKPTTVSDNSGSRSQIRNDDTIIPITTIDDNIDNINDFIDDEDENSSKNRYREGEQHDQVDEDDEEDESSPFPVPMDSNTLNRTSLLNLSKTTNQTTSQVTSGPHQQQTRESSSPNAAKDHWRNVKKELIENNKIESYSGWSNLFKAIKSAPSNTKLFLGIDSAAATGASGSVINGGGANSSGVDRLNSFTSNLDNKILNHWNQRTFRVLNDNLIFGGKLKEKTLDKYIENLDESLFDATDPFYYYKLTNEKKMPKFTKSVSVAGLAVDGVRSVMKKKIHKRNQAQRSISERDPAQEFEEVDLAPHRIDKQPEFNGTRMFRGQINYNGINDEDVNNYEDDEENEEGPCDAFTHACDSNRAFGVGFCGRLCDNYLDQNKKSKYSEIIKSIKQHRPYFTYWVTFVQIIICLVSLIAYGLAPIGFSYQIKKGLATTINLEKQMISYPVKENFWIGPVAMDLVHLGAKYAPCMRNDSNIWKAIELDKKRERESACCIRNDRGGCVQTNKEKCSELLSRFDKWNSSNPLSKNKRNSGSVCGLDPDFCSDPDSNKWPDDITQWPICKKPTSLYNSTVEQNQHMHCEIIGRPCCIGIQGECLITTLEHCDSMRGYFHADAHLCSQVDCMQDVCGMIEFLNPKSPDQVYRLFTSIFIHAGIIQLIVTILFQFFILRDIEKLAGCLRVAIIYVASGVIGNLASAIFLPYQAEVGPLGSQFGIIACLFVEIFHAWEIYSNPWTVLLKLVGCFIFLIIVGFLPMIDNFANVFGFLSGLLLASILFPNINLKGKCTRIIIISVSITTMIVLVAALIISFYIKPIDECKFCKFLSCPFGSTYCLDMDFNITRLN